MNSSRRGLSRLRLTLAVAIVAVIPACQAKPAERAEPNVVVFDGTEKHVFWCGHEVLSPLVMTTPSDRFAINGIQAMTVPRDTTGSEARLGPILGHVPLVARLHSEGLSYIEAGNRYGTAMAAIMDSAAWLIGPMPVADPTAAREAVRRILDPEVVDTSVSITLDSTSVTIPFWHGPMTRRLLDAATIAHVKKHGRPKLGPNHEGRMRFLRMMLHRAGPVLIIADETGETVFMGEKATSLYTDVRAFIAEVRRTRKVPPAPKIRMIGERAIASIGRAALAAKN